MADKKDIDPLLSYRDARKFISDMYTLDGKHDVNVRPKGPKISEENPKEAYVHVEITGQNEKTVKKVVDKIDDLAREKGGEKDVSSEILDMEGMTKGYRYVRAASYKFTD